MLVPLSILALIMIAGGVWLIRQDPRRLGAPELITWGSFALVAAAVNGILEALLPTGSIDGWALTAIVETASLMLAILGLWMAAAAVSIPGTRSSHLQKAFASLIGVGILVALAVFHVAFYRLDAMTSVALMALLTPLLLPAATLTTLLWWPILQQRLFAARRAPARAVVVLGAGIREDGTPTRLLARRIDRGIAELERADPEAPLVLTGGQGPDEVVAEAVSMAEYARERGVAQDRIVLEDASTSTLTNLSNARQLLIRREIDSDIVVVTSGYHAPRTAHTMRSVPVQGRVAPAQVHPAYLPAAMLRETMAILWQRRALTIACLLMTLIPAVYAVLGAIG